MDLRTRVREQLKAARHVLTMSFAPVDETPLIRLPELKRKLNLSEDIKSNRQGARNAVLRWIVWRSKAMRLAFVLSCVVSVLSLYQFGAQMAGFAAAYNRCSRAEAEWSAPTHARPLAATTRDSTVPVVTPNVSQRTEGNFPADANFSSSEAARCDALLSGRDVGGGGGGGGSGRSRLMEGGVVSHSMLLGDRTQARNSVCGTFRTPACFPLPAELLPQMPLIFVPSGFSDATGTEADLSIEWASGSRTGCTGGTPEYCGRASESGKCTALSEFDRATLVSCSKLYCRAVDALCPVGSPCAGSVLCGYDQYGEVCAATKDACQQPFRWHSIEFNVAISDNSFGSTQPVFATSEACEASELLSSTGAAQPDRLRAEVAIGEAQVGAQILNASVLAVMRNIAEGEGVGAAFENTSFFDSVLSVGRAYDTHYRQKTRWSAQLSMCGCLRRDHAGAGVIMDYAALNCTGPPTIVSGLSSGFQNLTIAEYCTQQVQKTVNEQYLGGGTRRTNRMALGSTFAAQTMLSFSVQSLFRPISMQNVPQSLTQFSRTDGCCTFPIDVKAPDSASNGATVQTGEEVVDPLTLLRATGTYSPTGATLHGRPVYRARNLGVLGEGLFLYFWPLPLDAASPGILWVIGPSVPAEASQTEQARVRESAYLTLQDTAFSADRLSPRATWTVRDAALLATGTLCEDNDAQAAALAREFSGFRFAEQISGCVDAGWSGLCEFPAGAAACRRTCGECPSYPVTCVDAEAALARITEGEFSNCGELSWACDLPEGFNSNVLPLPGGIGVGDVAHRFCPKTCGLCHGQEPGAAVCQDGETAISRITGGTVRCQQLACGSSTSSTLSCAADTTGSIVCPATCGRCAAQAPTACDICARVPGSSGPFQASFECARARQTVSALGQCSCGGATAPVLEDTAAQCCAGHCDVCNITSGVVQRTLTASTPLPAGLIAALSLPASSTCADAARAVATLLGPQCTRTGLQSLTPTVSTMVQQIAQACCCQAVPPGAPSPLSGTLFNFTSSSTHPAQPQGAVLTGQNIPSGGLVCPNPAGSTRRRLPAMPLRRASRHRVSRALSTSAGAQAQQNSATLLIVPGNGSVFCANANAEDEIGELVVDNTDESRTVTVRVALWADDRVSDARKLQQFTAQLCDATGHCLSSGPLQCFNDIVRLQPKTALRFPIVNNSATHEPVMRVTWQAVRDESVQYRSAAVATAASSVEALAAQEPSVSGAAIPAERERNAEPESCQGASNTTTATSSPSTQPWSACSATTHTQTKSQVCTARDGTLPLPASMCEALGIGQAGGGTLIRSCCTETEMLSAEFIRSPASAFGTTTLRLIPALTPLWWIWTTYRARASWKEWAASTWWVAMAWAVPFVIMFAQYLVPWQYVMAIDSRALVASLLSARSDSPTRDSFFGGAPPAPCNGSSVPPSGAQSALTGPSSPLGVLANARSVTDRASNIDISDPSAGLDQAFQDLALQQLQAQYAAYAGHEEQVYTYGQRIAFSFSSTAALVPLAFSLLPGVARGAIFAKLTMPTSPIPGWIFIACPLLFTPLLATAILSIVQLLSDPLISVAALLFTAATLLPMFKSRRLTRAFEDTRSLHKAQIFPMTQRCHHAVLALQCTAAVFFLVYVSTSDLEAISIEDIVSPGLALTLLLKSLTSYFITTVLACDVLLNCIVEIRMAECTTEPLRLADQECMAAAKSVHRKYKSGAEAGVEGSLQAGSEAENPAWVKVGVGQGNAGATAHAPATEERTSAAKDPKERAPSSSGGASADTDTSKNLLGSVGGTRTNPMLSQQQQQRPASQRELLSERAMRIYQDTAPEFAQTQDSRGSMAAV